MPSRRGSTCRWARTTPVVQLGRAIAGRGRCLVILDNFEQITRYAASTSQALAGWQHRRQFSGHHSRCLACPASRCWRCRRCGSAMPRRPVRQAGDFGAPELCSRRERTSLIEQLAGLLDGLPLAIELAAARTRVLSVTALLAHGSALQAVGRCRWAAGPPGHLAGDVRLVVGSAGRRRESALAQLSVFEGGFTLQSADAVLDLSACSKVPWLVDVLQSLVDKSFVRIVATDRFDLLASVKAYAGAHLSTEGRFPGSGPVALRHVQARHGAWFAALGPQRCGRGGLRRSANVIAACRWAIREKQGQSAVGALQGAWAALSRHGPSAAVRNSRRPCASCRVWMRLPRRLATPSGPARWSFWDTPRRRVGTAETALISARAGVTWHAKPICWSNWLTWMAATVIAPAETG